MIETATALAAGAVAAGASCRWNWWRPAVHDGMPALVYHKVGDCPKESKLKALWVKTTEFRRQMEYLVSRGYTTITFTQWRDALTGKARLPAKPVLITFDDGYANNYTEAYPILKEMGLKGNIFLVHDMIGGDNAWHNPASERRIPMLSWAQVREMQDSGVIEMGSHTMCHKNLAAISAQDVRWELVESKRRLEDKLGREMVGFAYPYGSGAFVPDVRQAAREAGYFFDFAFKQGISPLNWKPEMGPVRRLYVRGDDFMLDFYLNLTRGRARF